LPTTSRYNTASFRTATIANTSATVPAIPVVGPASTRSSRRSPQTVQERLTQQAIGDTRVPLALASIERAQQTESRQRYGLEDDVAVREEPRETPIGGCLGVPATTGS